MSRRMRFGALALLSATVLGFSVTGAPTEASTSGGGPTFSGSATVSQGAERGDRHSVAQAPEPAPAPAPQAGSLDPLLVRVLELTNIERARVGLPALTVDAQLNSAAQSHSEDQARRNTLTHYGPNGETPGDRIAATGYQFRMWAENAAMGYRSAESVMSGWMNSPGHRANILRAGVSEIGLGIAYTSSGTPYWTQVFAQPR